MAERAFPASARPEGARPDHPPFPVRKLQGESNERIRAFGVGERARRVARMATGLETAPSRWQRGEREQVPARLAHRPWYPCDGARRAGDGLPARVSPGRVVLVGLPDGGGD